MSTEENDTGMPASSPVVEEVDVVDIENQQAELEEQELKVHEACAR